MVSQEEKRPAEERIAAVDSWIAALSDRGEVGEIDPLILRSVLKELGARFEISIEQRESLAEYYNTKKRSGLDAVWGKEFVDTYKKWVEGFILEYESLEGKRPLPKLVPSGKKSSGMIQFFGELTAFAAGAMSFEDFKRYMEARALNGRLWQEGRSKERVRVKVPTKEEPILLGSFPPGFPQAAWNWLKTSKNLPLSPLVQAFKS